MTRDAARAREETQTALRSGGAGQRQPNECNEIVRAAANRTICSRSPGRRAHGAASEAHQGEQGPAHKRRRRNEDG